MRNRGEDAREIKNRLPPIHPGEILLDELEYLKLTPAKSAELLAVPLERLESILACESDVDAEFALRLERYFGSGARMWMNLQIAYSLEVAGSELAERIAEEIVPREEIREKAFESV